MTQHREHLLLRGLAPLLAALWVACAAAAHAQDYRTVLEHGIAAEKAGDFALAEKKYRRAIAMQPDDADIFRRLALVQAYSGRHDEALTTIARGLTLEPRNSDILLAQSRILAWSGQYDDALSGVDELIGGDSRNAEAYTVKGSILHYMGDAAAARASYEAALRLDPGNEEALAGLERLEQQRPTAQSSDRPDGSRKWRVDVGYAQSNFPNRDLADWKEGFLRIEHSWRNGIAFAARTDAGRRYGETDNSAGIELSKRWGRDAQAYLEAAAAPGATFMPRWMVGIGAGKRILKGGKLWGATVLTASARHREYASGVVQQIAPGMEKYLFEGAAWITAKWTATFDRETKSRLYGWYGRLDWQMLPRFRVYGGASGAPEMDGGVVSDTSSRFGGLALDLSEATRLGLDFVREVRDGTLVRNRYGVALTVFF